MTWELCIAAYIDKFCVPRGLGTRTVAAYRAALEQFRSYVEKKLGGIAPRDLRVMEVMGYVTHLRDERRNQNGAVNRAVIIIRQMYQALVSLRMLEPSENPMRDIPKMKAVPRKFKDTLSGEEVDKLLEQPRKDTVMGYRDRAILGLLYCTGIRASECTGLREKDVILQDSRIRVFGKGGDQRHVPLNDDVKILLEQYRRARGAVSPEAPFFRSRRGRGMARNSLYMMVRNTARHARLSKHVTPHILRHSFATQLVREGQNLVVVKELLGHRLLSSTEIYLHMTAIDLKGAVDKHPIGKMVERFMDLVPELKMRFQHPPGTRFAFNR